MPSLRSRRGLVSTLEPRTRFGVIDDCMTLSLSLFHVISVWHKIVLAFRLRRNVEQVWMYLFSVCSCIFSVFSIFGLNIVSLLNSNRWDLDSICQSTAGKVGAGCGCCVALTLLIMYLGNQKYQSGHTCMKTYQSYELFLEVTLTSYQQNFNVLMVVDVCGWFSWGNSVQFLGMKLTWPFHLQASDFLQRLALKDLTRKGWERFELWKKATWIHDRNAIRVHFRTPSQDCTPQNLRSFAILWEPWKNLCQGLQSRNANSLSLRVSKQKHHLIPLKTLWKK